MLARLFAVGAFAWALLVPATGTGALSASPVCGAMTGDELEKRLPVGPFAQRIGQTLCFDFTGDGRKDIVFTGWEFSTNGAHYWAAFRARADGWTKVIFKRDCCRVRRATKIRIVRSGEMVVVREPIFLEADRACCPTGGTRMGRWRWDGLSLRLVGMTGPPSSGEERRAGRGAR